MNYYTVKLVPEQVDAIFEQEFREAILYNLEEIASLENEESLKTFKVRDLVDMREYIEAARKVWSWHSVEPFPSLRVENPIMCTCGYCGATANHECCDDFE